MGVFAVDHSNASPVTSVEEVAGKFYGGADWPDSAVARAASAFAGSTGACRARSA